VKDAAESITSSHVEPDEVVWICDRFGECAQRSCVRDALVGPVFVIEDLEFVQGVQQATRLSRFLPRIGVARATRVASSGCAISG
jgi:hypothetical protein